MLHRFAHPAESFRPQRLVFRDLPEQAPAQMLESELDHPAEIARIELGFRGVLDRLLASGVPLEKGFLAAHTQLPGDPQMLQQRLIPEVLQIIFANRAEIAALLAEFASRFWSEAATLPTAPELAEMDKKLLSIGLEAARKLEATPESTRSRFFHLSRETAEVRAVTRTDLFANIISSQFLVLGIAEDRDAMKRCNPAVAG